MHTHGPRPFAALFVLISLCLSACALAKREAPSGSAPAAVEPPAPAPAASAAAPASDPAPPLTGRMILSEAEMALRTSAPSRDAERAGRLATDRGGYVVTKEALRTDDTVTTVNMVVRVPSAEFEGTLAALRSYGTVLKESVSGRDVTEEYSDTEAQLRAKRKLEERLLGIVAASKSVKEMLEVESELGRVRGDIERLEGHSRYLVNRAALATIHLSFASPTQPVAVETESVGSKLRNAFRESGGLFMNVTLGIVVALGAVAPLAIPACAVLLVLRSRRRRLALRRAETA